MREQSVKIETPAPGVCLFIIDESGILYSDTAREIYALNGLATFIWCCLEEGMDTRDIADRLSETFQIRPDDAKRQVIDLLDQWQELGLLAGSNALRQPARSTVIEDGGSILTDMPPWSMPVTIVSRRYRLLTTTLMVRFTAPEQEFWVHPILAHHEIKDDRVADTIIDIVDFDGQSLVYSDKKAAARVVSLDTLAPWVRAHFLNTAIERYDYSFEIHSGVVGVEGGCVMLPGASGSGKSTLTIALVKAGFSYFSDDVALLEHDTFAVRPLPLALGVKSTGWQVAGRYVPELFSLAVHRRADGKVLRYLPPSLIGHRADPNKSCVVRAIVFPRYTPDAPPRIESVSRTEALHRMLQDCRTVSGRLKEQNVSRLVSWIGTVKTYDLQYSSCDDAVDIIKGLV